MAMPMQHAEMGHVAPDGVVYHQRIDPTAEHEELRHMDEELVDPNEYVDEQEFRDDDDLGPHSLPPRAVHQCNICNKIFVSFKGLQQHAVIHTDQKPFGCDICGKAFRFKSNLFEHRSVHSGFTPHACPYCGKTCRLKGNLKKHLKTHVSTKEELEEAWKPFASNRRPPADIPDDAIIVRSTGEPFFTPPSRPRKRKLGLGPDARAWIDKIRRGELLPSATISEKMRRLAELLKAAEENSFSLEEVFEQARALSFERFDCPLCKSVFMSRLECAEHIELEHPMARMERPLFCEVCLKTFADRKSMEQHESYHKRVHLLIEHGDLEIVDPEILLPETCDVVEEEIDTVV
uniref:C2H2-type domain-containing protein n=2 Tax=Ascarididae TaxID=6250 RepID=A0A915BY27_PARUN